MASIVAPLVTGFSDAASGSVEFYQIGTSTASTLVYSDINGQSTVTTHTLDANGRITRCVDEAVDVVVKNSSGATVATFPWAIDATLVRSTNSAATGPNPNGNGQTIAGGITTLDAWMTLIATSFGDDDGYVLPTGSTASLLKTALALNLRWHNVKRQYGAGGAGTTDDTAAFQAAVTAAAAAGGGVVYFEAGTYKITGAITIASGVIVMGESAATTTIKQFTTAINGWLTITADDVTVMNLTFARDTTAMTGRAISSTKRTHVRGCVFNGFNGAHLYLGAAASDIRCVSCAFTHTEASGTYASGASAAATAKFTACTFVTSIASATGFDTSMYVLSGCELGITAISGTTFASGTVATWAGGLITSTTTSGTVTISAGTLNISGVSITTGSSGALRLTNSGTIKDGGCHFGSTDVVVGTPAADTDSYSVTRNNRRKLTINNPTAYTPDPEYAIHEIYAGNALAIGDPASAAHGGWEMTFIVRVQTNGNVSFGTNYAANGGALSVAINADVNNVVFKAIKSVATGAMITTGSNNGWSVSGGSAVPVANS